MTYYSSHERGTIVNRNTSDKKTKFSGKTSKLLLGAALCLPMLFQTVQAQCIEGKTASKPLGVTKSLKKKVKLSEMKDNYKLVYFWKSEYQNNIDLLDNLRDLQSVIDESKVNMKIVAVNSDIAKTGSRMNLFSDAKGWVAPYDDSNISFTFDKKQRAKKAYCISDFPTVLTLDENDALVGKFVGEPRARRVIANLTETFQGKS